LLQKLGFQRALPEDEARWRDSDDEVAFTMSLERKPTPPVVRVSWAKNCAEAPSHLGQ
jgi:hypothetical protein